MTDFMIVDDNEQNLHVLQVLLENEGHGVILARDGIEALEKARNNPPDMVISDVLMPGMDGFTLCRHWKNDGRLKHIPLIFYSATYTDDKDRELALKLGAVLYIVKPVDPSVLLEILNGVIAEHIGGKKVAPYKPMVEEAVYYKEYNATLIRKLENKLLELNEANRTIERELADRKKAEEALRASEERYCLLIENANDAIIILQDEVIKFTNHKTVELLGYFADELATIPLTNFIHPDDSETVLERLHGQEVLSTYTFRVINKLGEELWVEINAVLINWEGKPATLNFLRNITQQKKLEAQFLQSQKIEAIGTLAGGIAHDFNNLLSGIQGYTSLMLLDMDPGHPHYEKLKIIEDQVRSGAGLTKQLLEFARGGKYEVTVTDLNEIVEKTSTMFGRTKKEISIHRRYERDLWVVEVDRGQIEQMLLNLYVNAWQAMPGSGDMYLETANVILDEEFVRPYSVNSGKYVKVSVTDTGVGIDEKTKERIFDPFFTTKEMGRGTGLGLAVAYGVIKGHNGVINVLSEKGRGATFNVFLAASDKKIVKEEKVSGDVVRGEGTILLVDDEDVVADVSKEILEMLGYRVHVARSGLEAIAIYKETWSEIDLVILDMIMPGMSGGKTFDILKSINPDIRVILSSGYCVNGKVNEIMERGASTFLQKPIRIDELSNKVMDILNK